MRVIVQQTGQVLELEFSGVARALLDKLSISVETVLVVADGVLVMEDEDVSGASVIELVSVVSGG